MVLQAGLLAGGMMICLLPGFPVAMTDPNRLQSRGRLWFWVPIWVARTKFPFEFRMLCIQ